MDGLAIMLQGQLGTRLKSLLLALHLAKVNNRVLFVFWNEWRNDYTEQTLTLSQIWHQLGYIALPWEDACEIRKSAKDISNEGLQDCQGRMEDKTEMVFLPPNLSGSYLKAEDYVTLKECFDAHFIPWFRRRPEVAEYIAEAFLPARTVAMHLGDHFFGESLEVSVDVVRSSRGVIDRIIAEDWRWRFFIMASNHALAEALIEYYGDGWADLRVRPKPKATADAVAAEISVLVELCRQAPYFIGTDRSDLSAFISYSRGEPVETPAKLSPKLIQSLGINPLANSRCGIFDR